MQKNYQAVDENLKAKIIKTLAQLYKEYSYLPLSTFMNYVKAAGLGYITEEYAAKTGLELSEAQPEDTQLQEGLHGIQNANNLQELEDAVAKEIDLLTALGLSETSKVINYQQLIHNAVFRKLEQFLLKPSTPLTADDYTSQNKIRLSHIMQSAWMTGADETDYFLNEFEQLAGNRVP